MTLSTADVARYYDTQQVFYTYLWSPFALHYGMWYPDTRTLKEAIENTDRLIYRALEIEPHDVVLDAGCGVGGTSFHIATATRARIEAITLSRKQLNIARRQCYHLGLEDRVHFSQQDFCRTTFADLTFSKVFGIESVSHAIEKAKFIAEAYRLLKPGGRLAVCDAFLTTDQLPVSEQLIYESFLEGWALPSLVPTDTFKRLLTKSGFTRVIYQDMTMLIRRSSDKIYRHGLWTCPFSMVKSLFGTPRRDRAARYQKLLFDRRIASYGLFLAHKA